MTRALYHSEATPLLFEAQVSAVSGSEISLEATAFYPESGGQPGDTGLLRWPTGTVRVVSTHKDKATGIIWHRVAGQEVSGPLPPIGSVVTGEIDAAARWRHTQRHSAEHLLAQAFQRVSPSFQVAAVSMNSPECHLDLLGRPDEAQVRAAEALLRAALGRQELTLSTPSVSQAELQNYPLRRETKITGPVRLVIFSDAAGQYFDVSACGGTHVPRAAMCAPVVILRHERIKGELTRVTFMAGEEASEYLSGVYREARNLARSLSVPVEKLAERVAALGAEREDLKMEAAALRERLARSLVAAAPLQVLGLPVRFLELDDLSLLPGVLTGVTAGELTVALAPQGRCGVASGSPLISAEQLLRSALAVTGGKGGGKADLAQGFTAQPAAFFEVVSGLILSLTQPT